MFKLVCLICMFVVTVSAAATVMEFGGHYYDLITGNRTWLEARDEAASLSHLGMTGHLVTITTAAELDFLSNPSGPFKTANDWGYETWIGLHDSNTEGVLEWVTGEGYVALGNTVNWNSETNDYGALADLTVYGYGTGEYLIYDSGMQLDDYIVEYEPSGDPIPEPSTLLLLSFGFVGVIGVFFYRRRRIFGKASGKNVN